MNDFYYVSGVTVKMLYVLPMYQTSGIDIVKLNTITYKSELPQRKSIFCCIITTLTSLGPWTHGLAAAIGATHGTKDIIRLI